MQNQRLSLPRKAWLHSADPNQGCRAVGEKSSCFRVSGPDGYLQMNEKLRWMLTPESVGTFVQVGDDEPGIVGKLVGSMDRPRKYDPTYAMGVTSSKRTLITWKYESP